MKKLITFFLLLALPLVANGYDFSVENADGVTIYYNYYNNGTELEVARGSYSGAINIPAEVTYLGRTRKVTSISDNAFFECTGLTSITIGNSVTTIGGHAFWGCSGLTSVTIPNSVTSIGNDAFSYCSGLKKVIVKDIAAWCAISFYYSSSYGYLSNPLRYAQHLYSDEDKEITDLVIPNSVTSIGDGAFESCSGLTSVTIPNSVTSIGNYAFVGCSGLTSVTIPNSVTSIGNDAFSSCSGLTSVTIPNSVTSIGDWAFFNCSGLTSITIGNSVTTIGGDAFWGCSGLTSVTIPNSVTSIGNNAFFSCSGLTSVISKMENPCYIYNNCFDQDVFYNVTLYVPKGTTDKYKSTDYWNKFLFIEEGEPGSSTQPEEKKCATPSISYANKKLSFSCDTEGMEYHYTITDSDIKSDVSSSIDLSATYEISVYATKSGYTNSDVATATLFWTDAIFTVTAPETPTSAKEVKESIPVLISANGGVITVKSEQEGQAVAVYTADGKALGSANVKDGQAIVTTNLQRGEIVIVKVGGRSVKVKMSDF